MGISYFINTLFVVSLFYFLAITIEKEKEVTAIIWGYIFTVLLSIVAVIAQKMGLIGDIGTWFQGIRAQGFFMDPNDFSPFVVFAIFYLLNKAFSYHAFSLKYAGFLSLAAVVIGVLLASMSRAAILDLIIALLIFFSFSFFYKKKHSQIFVFIGAIAIITVIVFIYAGDEIIQYLTIRFMGSTDVLQDYDQDRFFFQRQGLIMGSTHLLGIGPGQFEYTYGYATHNLFVRIIAENGWIAFFFMAAMIIYIFTLLIYFAKKEAWNLPVYLFLAVYTGMIVNSFFLDTLHWRYLWFFMGMCTIIINQASREHKNTRK